MATIADERLGSWPRSWARPRSRLRAVRVVDVPGTGRQLLGNLREVDALLVVLDDWSGTRDPDDDLTTLQLELLVADREHVARRLERVEKQAKSGDPALRAEAESWVGCSPTVEGERPLSEYGELPPELEPLTTKPLVEVENGPGGIDLKLEAELAELPDGGGGRSFGTGRRRSRTSCGGSSRRSTWSRSSPPATRRPERGRFAAARRRSRRRRRSTRTSRAGSSAAR